MFPVRSKMLTIKQVLLFLNFVWNSEAGSKEMFCDYGVFLSVEFYKWEMFIETYFEVSFGFSNIFYVTVFTMINFIDFR